MERLSNGPHRVLLCRVPSGDKTFSRFQKGRWRIGILKVPKPFPRTIKWEDCQMDPIGFCFAESLRGINHFQDLKKADYRLLNEKSKTRFSNTIKWKDCQIDPNRFYFAESLRGIKKFSRFQKGGLPALKRKVQTPFLKHNKMERIKWTPLDSASQSPFGG